MPDSTPEYLLSEANKDTIQRHIAHLLRQQGSLQQSLRENQGNANAAAESLYLEIVEVIDTLNAVIEHLADNVEPTPAFLKRLPRSLGAVRNKLASALEKREVMPIQGQEEGLSVDFNLSRVVEKDASGERPPQTIVKVIRQGYRANGKVLRPVEVIVASPAQ